MATAIQTNDIWLTKKVYEEAERVHYENLAKAALTPLAGEIAKARQRLIESRDTFADVLQISSVSSVKQLEQQMTKFHEVLEQVQAEQLRLSERLLHVETMLKHGTHTQSTASNDWKPEAKQQCAAPAKKQEPMEEDDVDLFASDSEEDDAAAKVREERLAAYNAKKSKKPALIAKSNVILDVKPWDDETDMKKMEECVRKIEADGLLWGAAKLVPLAYGIHKLQISCVVEDEKVSIDWLTEQLEGLEDYVSILAALQH
nr:unnamed protein product [Callosobruchus analis]